jgi:predicted transcriptional regulator
MSVFVFSMRPGYAEKIYAGEKTVEIRTILPRHPAIAPGDAILIYETKPVGKVTGWFRATYAEATPLRVASDFGALAGKACVGADYVESRMRPRKGDDGACEIGAIGIGPHGRFEEPKPLSELGLERAPQSWCLAKREPWAPKEGE